MVSDIGDGSKSKGGREQEEEQEEREVAIGGTPL